MKILYVGMYYDYVNFTGKHFLSLMKNMNANFYGPGFSNEIDLQKGLEAYIEKHNGFDFIVTDLLFMEDKYFNDNGKSFKRFSKNHNYYFKEKDFIYIKVIKDILIKLKDITVLFKFSHDSYNMDKNLLNLLEKDNVYTITFGKQFIKRIDDKTILGEKFSGNINNNFYNFVNEFDKKIISFYHIIGEDEFNFSPLENRKYDISILGELYKSRREILNIIKNLKYQHPSKVHVYIFLFLHKLGLNVYSSYITLNIYNLIFRYYLFNSKLSYTDGSQLDLPIRKFFEISANASILVSKELFWFDNLGFVDKENYIAILSDNDILDVLEYYLKNIEVAQQIARSGQQLIYENHSVHARTKQLEDSMNRIINNTYCGSYWHKGKFGLEGKHESR